MDKSFQAIASAVLICCLLSPGPLLSSDTEEPIKGETTSGEQEDKSLLKYVFSDDYRPIHSILVDREGKLIARDLRNPAAVATELDYLLPD